MTKIKKHLSINKKLLVALVLLLVITGAILYWRKSSSHNTAATKSKPESIINLNGPTEQEKASGDAAKTAVLDQEQKRNSTPTTTTNGKRSVTPSITYAGQYGQQIEVGGFVSGVFEDGGTCTLTLQKGSGKQTTQVTGVKGASSVDCPVMAIPLSSLSKGTWVAVVSYSSSTSTGQSAERNIEVQ